MQRGKLWNLRLVVWDQSLLKSHNSIVEQKAIGDKGHESPNEGFMSLLALEIDGEWLPVNINTLNDVTKLHITLYLISFKNFNDYKQNFNA